MTHRGIRRAIIGVAASCAILGAGCKEKEAAQVVSDAARATATQTPAPAPVEDAPPARRVFTHKLANEADFRAYSKQVGGERFTKFVVDVRTDAVYFFDVSVYTIHRDFVFAELYKQPETKALKKRFFKNYNRNKPEFILGFLVHHLGADQWTMAFWSGDLIEPRDVERAYKRLTATFYLGARVKYRPDSHYQEYIAKKLTGIPVITNDQIYKGASYQVFNEGKAIGVLRLVKGGATFEDLTFDRHEIVLLPETLPDITPVAGIISDTFSTPLSHVSLRARAWGIPNIGLKKATTTYRALVGKTVYFEAGPVKHTLRVATAQEIAGWKTRRARAKTVVVPAADLATTDLRPLTELRSADVTAYGAKTANLGEIARANVPNVVVPAGFGVPLHFYQAHMKASGLDARVATLMKDKRFRTDASFRKDELGKLRKAIIAAPMDAQFRKLLLGETKKLAGDKGVFVRSSTNAEDLAGFNGAGLYDTVPNVKGDDALVAAVKQVWSSVWNLRAYEEREFFGIDHSRVYGAVLVQVGVNPTAAGVLVTPRTNIPKVERQYIINAKSGLGIRVVNGKKSPEIVHYTHHTKALRILSRSDETTQLVFDEAGGVKEVPIPNAGKAVLSDPRARKLGAAAHAIVKLFPTVAQLDIEWLYVGDELNIVQARPYVGAGGR